MFKLRRPIALFLSATTILIGSALIWGEYSQTSTKQSELKKLQVQLEQQKSQSREIQERLKRLSDPSYAKQVEVSKYSLTNPKEGEYVFVLPKEGN